jgi:hypothetical protein
MSGNTSWFCADIEFLRASLDQGPKVAASRDVNDWKKLLLEKLSGQKAGALLKDVAHMSPLAPFKDGK